MVFLEKVSDLDWFQVKPMKIEIAALAYSRAYPERDRISWTEGVQRARDIGIDPISHALMYEFVKNYKDIATDFMGQHGNNNHSWMTGTFVFHNFRRHKNGKPGNKIDKGGSYYEFPDEFFGKTCFVDFPNYSIRNDGIKNIITVADKSLIMPSGAVRLGGPYAADPITKLPTHELGNDIDFIITERIWMGLAAAISSMNKCYPCGIHQGSEGFIVYRRM